MLLRKALHFLKVSKMSAASVTSEFETFVRNGRKILGAGLNYKPLLKINKMSEPERPLIFLKPPSSYIEVGQNIMIPQGFQVNEEIELGVIIGKTGKHIPVEEALDYVAGYCVALDLTASNELATARAIGHPWSIGKGFDTATPVSRFITKDEIPDPSNVDLFLNVNDEIRQEGNTGDLIFSIPTLISYISQYMTLQPNDLILTGTPPGMSPIVPGDNIQGGIKNILTMTFNVIDDVNKN